MFYLLVKDGVKYFCSPDYNYKFNMANGNFERWGKNKEDNPSYSPFGNEILDIEVSTICHGISGKPCEHCYKSNTAKGENMRLETFKTIMSKMPKNNNGDFFLTQTALGIGSIDANPDLFPILEYSRSIGVIPNLTINGDRMTSELYDKLANVLGACAVSLYFPKDVCYNAVKELTDRGMTQVNIHCMVSEETYDRCLEVLNDSKTDPRLEKLNAIVFLLMKPKGKRNNYTLLSFDKYSALVNKALAEGISIGFDSCSAPLFLESVKETPNFEKFETVCESCESSLFSGYINVEGRYFHCSFTEGEDGWKGIDVVNCNNFVDDVWYADETKRFRKSLTDQHHDLSSTMRRCPIFDLKLANV